MRLRNKLQEIGLERVITVARNRGYGIAATMGGGTER
jgi:acetolactate synthase regulatory subunit